MRKRTAFLFAFVALLVLGCVPTPEAEVVLKKDTQRMIETAENAEQESLREMAEVPENMHIFQEVASTRTDVQITIDAEVVMPDTTAMPVVHMRHGEIQEDILRNIQRLIGNGSGALDDFPRAYYLAEAQKWADRRDAGELDKYDSVEELNAAIAKLLATANEAPETPVFKEEDPLDEARERGCTIYFGWSDQETVFQLNFGPAGHIYFLRDIQDDQAFGAYTVTTEGFNGCLMSANPINNLQGRIDRGEITLRLPERSLEDATAFAQKVLQDIGLREFTCVGARIAPLIPNRHNIERNCRCVYEVLFTRQINGVNITYTDVDSSNSAFGTNSYAPSWGYEKIQMFVDDAGVFGLLFNEQYEILDTTVPSAKLISLEDAIKSFVNMIELKFARTESSTIKKDATIQVTEIRLGLTRVQEKGDLEQGYLVPSWTFFGVYDMDARGAQGYDGTDPLLTVNALDGTIIDLNVGY